jgi:hypothetical protein
MRFSRGRIAAAAVGLALLVVLLAATGASAAEPPTLGSLSISPPSVNVTSSSATVTVSAEIVSTPGATGGSVAFESPTGSQSTGNVSFTKVSGTANKGVWEASVPIKQYSASGTWRASVSLSDAEGNHVQLSSTQLAGKAFPHSVLVEGTEDNEPPVLAGLTFSSRLVNVSASSQTVTVTAHITDNLSGVTSASIDFRPPSGKPTIGRVPLTKVSGTALDGNYEATVTFPRYAPAGVWKIATINMADNVGNEASLSTLRVEAKGLPATVRVEDLTEDIQAPGLSELKISPASVNVTASAQSVAVTAGITDNLSGVAGASVSFTSPSGKQFTALASLSKVSGTETSGTWEATVSFPQFIQSGTWKVSTLNLTDNVGNEARLSAAQLEAKALPATVAVTSTEDTEAPALAGFAISPSTVNTTTGSQTATATAEITDNLSGFAHGTIVFESPNGKQSTATASFSRVSGSATSGSYEAQVTFKQWVQSGSWKVANLKLVDAVGNEVNFSAAQLEAKAFAHAVTVESTEDTEAPGLTGLTISPSSIDTAAADQLVTVTAHATDNLSGVAAGALVFENPASKKMTGQALFTKVSGTETNGIYEAVVRFKESSESGTWKVGGFNLNDNAGNQAAFSAAQLEAKGFPDTVVNETGQPPTIRRLSPRKAPAAGGVTVTITGTNFTGATEVKFGPTGSPEIKVINPNSMTAVVPPGTSGVAEVSVTTPLGTSAPTARARFKYGKPTVNGVSPNHGPRAGGTEVTITGSGFALGSATTFKFGKVLATSVHCTSTKTCTAVSPAALSKALTVNVQASVGTKRSASTLEDRFNYT